MSTAPEQKPIARYDRDTLEVVWLGPLTQGPGTADLFAAPTQAQEVALDDAEILALAHRKATTYAHRSDPRYYSYGFVPHSLLDFARALLKAQKGKT